MLEPFPDFAFFNDFYFMGFMVFGLRINNYISTFNGITEVVGLSKSLENLFYGFYIKPSGELLFFESQVIVRDGYIVKSL